MSDLDRRAHEMMAKAAAANLARELAEVKRIADRMLSDLQRPDGPVAYTSHGRQLAAVAAEAARYNTEVATLAEIAPLVGGDR